MNLGFRNVACMRGGRMVFSGISFDLAAGDATIVTGPNGVGKSSLIRLAAGLLAPSEGRVTRDADAALLTEASALDTDRPLVAALRFWAGFDRAEDPEKRVAHAIEALDLAALADIPVRLLSTGQRRRASIARVVASDAAIWLLDEPANGLDSASVAKLEHAIARHRAGGGIALIATHLPVDLPDAREVAL